MAGLVHLILHTLSKTNGPPWPNSTGLGSDLHCLLQSDTPLTRLEPETPCLVWLSSNRRRFTPLHPAFARTISISNTGKTGKWKCCKSSTRLLSGQVCATTPLSSPSSCGHGFSGTCSLFPCPFFLPLLSFFQQGCGKKELLPVSSVVIYHHKQQSWMGKVLLFPLTFSPCTQQGVSELLLEETRNPNQSSDCRRCRIRAARHCPGGQEQQQHSGLYQN